MVEKLIILRYCFATFWEPDLDIRFAVTWRAASYPQALFKMGRWVFAVLLDKAADTTRDPGYLLGWEGSDEACSSQKVLQKESV